jgi:hypothetical protein
MLAAFCSLPFQLIITRVRCASGTAAGVADELGQAHHEDKQEEVTGANPLLH